MSNLPDRIHYVANAGVMLESGGRKVLIDGLIHHDHQVFNKYSTLIEEQILEGLPPFDNLDLVLITHGHVDHFEKHLLARFCRSHPQVPVVSGGPTLDMLRPLLPVEANLVEVSPQRYEGRELNLNGIDFTAVSLLHSGQQYADVLNLGFIIRLGRVFAHTGDAINHRENIQVLARHGAARPVAPETPEGRTESAENAGAVMIVPFPYLTLPLAFKQFRKTLDPACVFVMHLPNASCDPGDWIRATHDALEKQRNCGLRIILAKKEGDVFNV